MPTSPDAPLVGYHSENAIPVLPVADLQKGIAFYRAKLGFVLDWGGEPGSAVCSVSHEGHPIMLQKNPGRGPGCVWIGVSNLRQIWEARLRDPAIQIIQPPTNQPWALEMRLADPDGNILWLGSEALSDVPHGQTPDWAEA